MNDEKMKIGDEVAFHWSDGRPDTVVVITHIGRDGFIDGMDAKGTLYASKNPQKWTKTGRYFPLVTQLLRQIMGRGINGDLISRTEAVEKAKECFDMGDCYCDKPAIIGMLNSLTPAQAEPAIPLQWIEAQIEWLKSLDNAFSTLTAGQISAMVNKWKDEQDG